MRWIDWIDQVLRIAYASDTYGCSCTCPGCRRELVGVVKPHTTEGDPIVLFNCSCGRVSRWEFSAPAPILLDRETHAEANQ